MFVFLRYHLFRACRAVFIPLSYNHHIVELGQETPNLMRHQTEHAATTGYGCGVCLGMDPISTSKREIVYGIRERFTIE
jgi:hypothetical protein